MSAPQQVRCPHPREDGRGRKDCHRLLATELAGFYRGECPRCGKRVVAVTPGRIEIIDGDGVIVVTVTKTTMGAPLTS